MSVWTRDEQHRLVRITPQQSLRNSIVRCLFHSPSIPLMEHTKNQQIPFNPNEQGLPFNPQRSFDPLRQGDGFVPPGVSYHLTRTTPFASVLGESGSPVTICSQGLWADMDNRPSIPSFNV